MDDVVQMTPEEALVCLQRPDGIMEPDIMKAVEVYLTSGTAESAAEALAQNYVGTAQICNIMIDWIVELSDTPDPPPTKTVVKRGRGRKLEKKEKPKEEVPKEEEEVTNPKSPSKKSERVKVNGRQDAAKCVEETLANIVLRSFCPDAADRIFEDGGIGIDWLPPLIVHRRWRRFLYELVEQYPQCLMLNFAVKLISDAGFQNEISRVNTAAQQLDIFSKVFLTSIDGVLKELSKGCKTAAFEKAFGEMIKVVCNNEHTYLFAEAVLNYLRRKLKGRQELACRFLDEELRDSLDNKEFESTTIRMAMLQTGEDQINTTVSQAVLSLMSKGELNPADITLVYEQFILPIPPPVDVIREPFFIEMLLDSLFHSDGPKVVPEHRDKYIYLLAYAASVCETMNKNGLRTQSRLELDPCRHNLEKAVVLLDGSDDLLADLQEIMRCCRSAVVAAGVLFHVKTLLLSEARIGDVPSSALTLLDYVSSTHKQLQDEIFDICCEVYDKIAREPEAAEVIMERQRTVVDRFVHLLSCGCVVTVLEKILEMFQEGQIDASLVRYFAVEVLDIVSPPYSKDFTSLFLPLVSDEEIFDQAVCLRIPAASEFMNYCKQQTTSTS